MRDDYTASNGPQEDTAVSNPQSSAPYVPPVVRVRNLKTLEYTVNNGWRLDGPTRQVYTTLGMLGDEHGRVRNCSQDFIGDLCDINSKTTVGSCLDDLAELEMIGVVVHPIRPDQTRECNEYIILGLDRPPRPKTKRCSNPIQAAKNAHREEKHLEEKEQLELVRLQEKRELEDEIRRLQAEVDLLRSGVAPEDVPAHGHVVTMETPESPSYETTAVSDAPETDTYGHVVTMGQDAEGPEEADRPPYGQFPYIELPADMPAEAPRDWIDTLFAKVYDHGLSELSGGTWRNRGDARNRYYREPELLVRQAADLQADHLAREAHRQHRSPGREHIPTELPEWQGDVDPEAERIWAAVQEGMAQRLPRPTYETWIRPTRGVSLLGNTLRILVASPFAAEWLERRMHSALLGAVQEAAERPVELEYVVPPPPENQE